MNRDIRRKVEEKISYHAVYERSYLEALHFAHENGFKGIQIAVESPNLSPFNLTSSQIVAVSQYLQKTGLYIVFHGPDDITSLYEGHPALVEGIFSYYNRLFKIAAKLSVPLITIHLGKMTTFPTAFSDGRENHELPPTDFPMYFKTLAANLDRLVTMVQNRFVLCIENYFLHPRALEILLPYINDGEVSLCWDLAKNFNRDGTLDRKLEDFFRDNISAVKQVHLHDINTKGRGHRVIGTGKLNFLTYLNLLADQSVMDFCIEVRPGVLAKKSLGALGQICDGER